MATTIWKGYLTFGLISIPIKLQRAARAEKVSFRQLHRADATRVRQGYFRDTPPPEPEAEEEEAEPAPIHSVSPPRGKAALQLEPPRGTPRPAPPVIEEPAEPETTVPVSRTDIVKGYEYAKDKYVVINKEDLEKITPQTAREMQINEFVRLAEVDPIYFETSYYILPDKGGEKPYALLLAALRQTGYAAVAQVAMHNREHVVVVRPGRTGMILHMMYYENEVHRDDEYRTSIDAVSDKELKLAAMLIENLAAPFEPEKYHDTYREKLNQLIEARVAGQETVEAPTPQKNAPVLNILEALQRSLAQTPKKPAAAEAATATVAEAEAPKKKRAGAKK